MKNIYLSFLGIGSDRKTPGVFNYDKTVYTLDGKTSGQTEFVQVAEIQMLGAHRFDGILIIATQKSFDAHFHRLKAQLNEAGASHVEHIIISEDMSPSGQWSWFEQILDEIDFGAELTLDLTHGYRLIPIVFSAAINFLQKSKNVKINAIYYGAYDSNRECSPIVDMKEFYLINEWADGVSRLVEDADVRKIAETAVKTPQFQVGELNDGNLINAFEDLTSAIRNVDINNISEKTIRTIQLLKEKERGASATGRILLKLVMDKFASLMAYIPTTGLYDANYFRFQLQIIQLLLEHHLFMQAYTVMREFIASLGLIAIQTE
jgi:CRISPR-associated DxTHG motif protein